MRPAQRAAIRSRVEPSGEEGQLDLTLAYPTQPQPRPRPHAATSATLTGTSAVYKTFAYDQVGNLDYVNSPAESDYTFDAENRVKTRTYGAATETYAYDGAGALLKRTASGASGSETVVYIGGAYEKDLTTGAVTKYYQAAGRVVAMRKGGTLQYLLADHLGSTAAVTDASGTVVSSRTYWPYGAERSLSSDGRVTDLWYTGQRDEDFDGLGLYNYKARFYSTVVGRFVSADTVTRDGLNRYAYTRDNPLRYSDPTGHGGNNDDGTTCPPMRPDCEIDGGPPPLGGDACHGDPVCQLQSAAAYCATNPGDSRCGGPYGPPDSAADAPPCPDVSGSTSSSTEPAVAGALGVVEVGTLADPVPGDEVVVGAALACALWCGDAINAVGSAAKDLYDSAKKTRQTGKERGSDVPEWSRDVGQQIGGRRPDEKPAEYTKRLMDAKYGEGWERDPQRREEARRIQKGVSRGGLK